MCLGFFTIKLTVTTLLATGDFSERQTDRQTERQTPSVAQISVSKLSGCLEI